MLDNVYLGAVLPRFCIFDDFMSFFSGKFPFPSVE